jgi:hypothetical protein
LRDWQEAGALLRADGFSVRPKTGPPVQGMQIVACRSTSDGSAGRELACRFHQADIHSRVRATADGDLALLEWEVPAR